jgi:nucleobase:cation symporter-1, NCS1 family
MLLLILYSAVTDFSSAAILLWDYWVVHRQKMDTLAGYRPHSIYWYTYGINPRAIIAFLVGLVPNLPGLINSVNPKVKVGSGARPYDFGWLLGFGATSLVYIGLSYAFPPTESLIDVAILPDEYYDGHVEGVDGVHAATEKGSTYGEEREMEHDELKVI